MIPNAHKIHWLQGAGLFPLPDKPAGIELMSAIAEKSCLAWNRLHPIGTPVKCYRSYGDEKTAFHSVTRSASWVMGGHSAMVMVDGHDGAYALTHVVPLVGRAEVTGQANLLTLQSCVTMVLQDLVGTHGEEVAA